MKKVLVIGCRGMAGHVVEKYLESTGNYEIWGIARGVESKNKLINLDVSNTIELEKIIEDKLFDVVINCIGLLNKTAEDNHSIWCKTCSIIIMKMLFFGPLVKPV